MRCSSSSELAQGGNAGRGGLIFSEERGVVATALETMVRLPTHAVAASGVGGVVLPAARSLASADKLGCRDRS